MKKLTVIINVPEKDTDSNPSRTAEHIEKGIVTWIQDECKELVDAYSKISRRDVTITIQKEKDDV